MEWVETTADTVEDAKDEALDRLGVDESEAEFDVVQEPKKELFGLRRTEARVRARVRPVAPPPKRPRRGADGDRGAAGGRGRGGRATTDVGAGSSDQGERDRTEPPGPTTAEAPADATERTTMQDTGPSPDATGASVGPEEQADLASAFLMELVGHLGLEGCSTSVEPIEDDIIEVRVDGPEVGVLVGPRGGTLNALQELTKTVLQRQTPPDAVGRVRVDVAGYRERRREALAEFITGVAREVLDTGEDRALEPMNAADRKVVHDTVNDIDGVRTVSEGADPDRRVVLVADDD